jgi:hypothetical protein
MWEPWRLTTLWASTACYRDSYTIFFFTFYMNDSVSFGITAFTFAERSPLRLLPLLPLPSAPPPTPLPPLLLLLCLFHQALFPEILKFIAHIFSANVISKCHCITVAQWKGHICGNHSQRWQLSNSPVKFSMDIILVTICLEGLYAQQIKWYWVQVFHRLSLSLCVRVCVRTCTCSILHNLIYYELHEVA